MSFIEWSEEMSVGVSELDYQHKMFLTYINDLNSAIVSGAAHLLIQVTMENLAKHMKGHFTTEENLMEKYGYQGLEEHRKLHQELEREVNSFKAKYEANQQIEKELLIFLKKWVTDHVMNEDKKFVGVVKEEPMWE
mgnify:CR=1 FL=1